MFKLLRGLMSGGPYYVRITRSHLSMRDLSSGGTFETAAKISLNGSNVIVSVGDIASVDAVRTIEPFNHPRIAISDFACAVKIVQYSLQKMTRLKWISPSPGLVIQPEMDLVGGLSEIERRAFLEMGDSAGARRTVVHYGRLLSNDDAAALAKGSP